MYKFNKKVINQNNKGNEENISKQWIAGGGLWNYLNKNWKVNGNST